MNLRSFRILRFLPISHSVEHDDVQLFRTDQTQPDNLNSCVPFSDAAAPVSHIVEHVDVHDELDSTTLVFLRQDSPLLVRNIPHKEASIDNTDEESRSSGSDPTLTSQQEVLAASASSAHATLDGVHSAIQPAALPGPRVRRFKILNFNL
jgi:hypothetical protein